jgi:hypothetical protein
LITRKIFDEVYRSYGSFLCGLYRSPLILSTQNNWKIYSSVYLNLYIFGQQTGKQTILHLMSNSIPWLQSALNFCMNGVW